MKSSIKINKDLTFFIQKYLENRPAFMSIIRSQEAVLFLKNKKYIKSPILDFGCGDGFFAKTVFSNEKLKIIGLDVKDSRATEAKNLKIYKKVVIYNGDKIPYPTKSFKTIISNCVLEHLDNLNFSLKEIHRVLKKDGYFLTSVMTDRWEDYLFGRKIFGNAYINFMRQKQIHQNLLSVNQWKKVFQKVGFKIVKTQGYLNKEQSQWLDILHYFSLPSLLSYRFFKKWVLFSNWYKIIKFDQLIENLVMKKSKLNQSAACFFVLQKI